MKLQIVTDTAADCTSEEITELSIDVLELPVTFEGENEPCRDINLFWKNLLSDKTAFTSQPSPEAIKNLFLEAEKNGNTVICILISSHFSGTYETAVKIKEETGYDKIHIIDSLNASVAEKVLVYEACKMRDADRPAEEIVARLEELKHKVRLLACIDTLKYLARGGRISKSSANIGTLLNVKPLITFVDGKIINFGKTVGNGLAMVKLIDKMKSDKPSKDYAPIPIYSHDNKNCLTFIEKAKAKGIEIEKALLTPIGATIGTHIGPGGFGVVYVTDK